MSKVNSEMKRDMFLDCELGFKEFARIPIGDSSKLFTREDVVNSPSHYNQGGIETIDYMKAYSTPEEFQGHLRLTALKYLSRYGKKDDELQELKKAQWYLNKLISEIE